MVFTTDIFHSLQKQALVSEALTICVIRGMRVGSTRLRMCVGMGLSSQLLVCMLDIKLVTCSAVSGANFQRVGMSVASGIKTGVWEKLSQILSIFVMK